MAFKGHFIFFCLFNGSTIGVQSHFNMSQDIKKLLGVANSLGHTVGQRETPRGVMRRSKEAEERIPSEPGPGRSKASGSKVQPQPGQKEQISVSKVQPHPSQGYIDLQGLQQRIWVSEGRAPY